MTLRIGVANPTCLAFKAEFFNSISCDLWCVSETAVTRSMQPSIARAFSTFDYRICWGAPVPVQRLCTRGDEVKKGLCLGVCMIARSSVSIRPSRNVIPPHWLETCRIMQGFVQLRSCVIRVIVVYGVQCNASQAAAKNRALWEVYPFFGWIL